ncbi:BON domain-containing protein [Hydrogenophaga sp. RWCD_12]|uniref:BON domain-containing protein n=1 Tax=Hydrogenophaga sp. RWCD_12 TaxID=3391190 RepID=UPI003984A1C9
MKSDSQLKQDVTAELQWEPSVHAAQIGVEVADGVVTLSGEVSSYYEKWNAERAAQRVQGVRALAVEMKVKLSALGHRTDADIAQSAQHILNWNSLLPPGAVKVLVENGWITLSGVLPWQYQRQSAADAVHSLPGVTGVSNQIAIQPTVSASAIKSDIEVALRRRATTDGMNIAVDVQGGDVTLTGPVHSWSERELATRSAWGSAGVHKVVDRMNLVL